MSGALGAMMGAGTGLDPAQGMMPLSPDQGLSQDNAKMVPRDRPVVPEPRRKLVEQWARDIQDAKRHWRRAFDRMRWNMEFVAGDQWQLQPGVRRRRRRRASDAERIDRDDRYVANIALRHVLQRTAELYPANPTVKAKRRSRIMAANWDGTQQSLVQAQQAMLQTMQTGMPLPPQAQQILMEAEQVKAYDQLMDRIAKTLELFYEYNVAEQVHPFQTMMKMTVRRAVVTGVGFVKVGFQRAMQLTPEIEARIADMSERLATIERLSADLADKETMPDDAEAEQLRVAITSLTQEGGLIVREGLTFDYPDSTAIIPDTKCRGLRGFIGSDWVAQEYLLDPDQVQEIYGVDLRSAGYTAYTDDGLSTETSSRSYDAGGTAGSTAGKCEPACVWEVYSRRDGAVYVVCDGYPDFLQEPGRPETWLERFWPWFAIVLNEAYDDRTVYPQSDIDLLRDMQLELNRARQGLREHRRANRPKTAVAAGVLEEVDKDKLREHPANALLELNALSPGQKIDDVLQAVKPPPIDPAVYDTAPTFEDLLRVLGSDQADQGSTSGATATEVSVAQFSQHTDLSSVVDDLNETLTEIARSGGQILLLNTSQQVVMDTIGPGAVWPQLSADMVAKNLWLEVEAGVDSLPRQQQEVQMFTQLIPLIQRIPGISPEWMARQLIKRLGADVDLSDAFAEGMPSMEAMNQLMSRPPAGGPPAPGQPGQEGEGAGGASAGPSGAGRGPPRPPNPQADPNAQGPQGLTNSIQGPGTQGPLGPRVPPLQVFGANGNRPGTGGGMPRMPAQNQGLPTP
jgi:hypothetical protein